LCAARWRYPPFTTLLYPNRGDRADIIDHSWLEIGVGDQLPDSYSKSVLKRRQMLSRVIDNDQYFSYWACPPPKARPVEGARSVTSNSYMVLPGVEPGFFLLAKVSACPSPLTGTAQTEASPDEQHPERHYDDRRTNIRQPEHDYRDQHHESQAQVVAERIPERLEERVDALNQHCLAKLQMRQADHCPVDQQRRNHQRHEQHQSVLWKQVIDQDA